MNQSAVIILEVATPHGPAPSVGGVWFDAEHYVTIFEKEFREVPWARSNVGNDGVRCEVAFRFEQINYFSRIAGPVPDVVCNTAGETFD